MLDFFAQFRHCIAMHKHIIYLALFSLLLTLPALAQRASFNEAIVEGSPSVVNIYTQKTVRERAKSPFSQHPLFKDPFFNQFFNNQAGPIRNRVEKSLGSGVIVTSQGHVVTNLHVIEGAEDIRVVLHDGIEYPATYLGGDQKLDLAVLELNINAATARTLPVATFVNSDDIQVGDVALAIGNPFGVGQSVSLGIVSAVGRGNATLSQFSTYIQTDAAINPGNSGGALVDSTGAVIGINTAIFSKGGGSNGIGFAIPANLVQAVVEDILTTGTVERAWFGATGQNVTSALAHQLGLQKAQGVLVNELANGGPAALAGIKIGDVITHFDSRPIANTGGLNAQILATPRASSREIPVSVWRDGQTVTLPVSLRSLPKRESSARQVLAGQHPLAGYTVEALSPALNQQLGLDLNETGVAIIKTPKVRTKLALKVGDVLRDINGRDIKTLEDLGAALQRRPREWRLTYTRGNRVFRVIVR